MGAKIKLAPEGEVKTNLRQIGAKTNLRQMGANSNFLSNLSKFTEFEYNEIIDLASEIKNDKYNYLQEMIR